MQLVILAAGHGRRFGGLKQLAPVGPDGSAIMDYTARSARTCGVDGVVLVVREEIRDEIAGHVQAFWPGDLPVELVCQEPVPGTASAVLSVRQQVHGPFGVANADDLYGDEALAALLGHFAGTAPDTADDHLLVAYRLAQTVLTEGQFTRGLCEVGPDGRLERIAEHRVQLEKDGGFRAQPLGTNEEWRSLSGDERVSMNLWGFHPRLFDALEAAVTGYRPENQERPEILLPEVVGELVKSGRDRVTVIQTAARCVGVTHRDDIGMVREHLAPDPQATPPLGALRGG